MWMPNIKFYEKPFQWDLSFSMQAQNRQTNGYIGKKLIVTLRNVANVSNNTQTMRKPYVYLCVRLTAVTN